MMLSEETAIADAALPLVQFRSHLRLGSGFGEDGLQDDLLKGFLRAAIATIEARTGKVLISRDFSWMVYAWSNPARACLPVAPVTAITGFTLVDAAAAEVTVAAERFWLERDRQAPVLRPSGALLPSIPRGGHARIMLSAGMAAEWGDLPADLGQAVLLLAAHYYEYRDETALGPGCMPFGVSSLIDRYRVLRLSPRAVQ
ncbi:MAG: head-tail connector protein [Pseudodonghicola sp.]|nr:head-tail connector protein [Pseudodonghicola sp.]